jgi:hypothetical protein
LSVLGFTASEGHYYCLSLFLRLLMAIILSVLRFTASDGHYIVCP